MLLFDKFGQASLGPEPSTGELSPIGPSSERLRDWFPGNFAAYGRVLHGVDAPGAQGTMWSDLARMIGQEPTRLMTWSQLLASVPIAVKPAINGPAIGCLSHEQLSLVERAIRGTLPCESIYYGLWHGYGWIQPGSDEAPPDSRFAVAKRTGLELPYRTYLTAQGDLGLVTQIGAIFGGQEGQYQSPNLWWPASHEWFVYTDIDCRSTIVGGSRDLIDTLVQSTELECFEVFLGDVVADHDGLPGW